MCLYIIYRCLEDLGCPGTSLQREHSYARMRRRHLPHVASIGRQIGTRGLDKPLAQLTLLLLAQMIAGRTLVDEGTQRDGLHASALVGPLDD